jgi:hypothetical protein
VQGSGGIFSNWRELLNQADLPEGVRAGYGLAIGGYLDATATG